jgi:hypothetical protein
MAQENKHEGEEGQDLLVVEEEEEEKKKHRSMVVARGILGTIEMFIKGL